ncbi:MAG: hypothetical protein ABL955_15175, partial [Elusimicrobiota bacterium]
MKNPLGPGVIVLALGLTSIPAARATAEVMEGDHLVIVGLGLGRTFSRIKGVQGYDFDQDGVVDGFSKDTDLNYGTISAPVSVQYYYHWSPSWAFGISAEYLAMKATSSWNLRPYALSGGSQVFSGFVETKSFSYELIPMARYYMQAHKRVNPYFIGGLGLNRFSASAVQTYN